MIKQLENNFIYKSKKGKKRLFSREQINRKV